jgi:hypothetical protein
MPAPAEHWGISNGVTVVDERGGTVKIETPQGTGMEFNRTLDLPYGEALPFWGLYPILSFNNTILRGSTSYRDWLQEDVKAGLDQKFYVATIRGIFPGTFVTVSGYPHGYLRLTVKDLGYDKEKKLWYFTADTTSDVKKGEVFGNKNSTPVMAMDTYAHNENQTCDMQLQRHNYSQGDTYMYYARFFYQGDNHSTAGDENGILYGAFVSSENDIFRSQVDKWNAATGELVYKGTDAGKTLGSGRPIINLNPAKWTTNGTVVIVRPATWTDDSANLENPVYHGKTFPTTIEPNRVGIRSLRMGGLIRFSADASVTEDAVGRYLAIDEKDEVLPNVKTGVVRRWYLIDSVTKNDDGTKDVRIIRHWWGAKSAGSPVLYKPENYSWDGHEKPLHYIIAPGANAYDVADGVSNPKRTIRLVPTPFANTAADFAAGDEIEQAVGPDPWKPTVLRAWLWDAVPSSYPCTVIDVANLGTYVTRDSVLQVHGGSTGDIEKDKAMRYDRSPPWEKYLDFSATVNDGIKFGADTGDAAILFVQPNHRTQPIKWNYGIESNQPPKVASLTVATDTGDFHLSGGDLRVNGSVVTTGLSAGEKPARNLRGLNVPVPAGSKELIVKFPQPEADDAYMAVLQLSWLTNHAVVNRTAEGFTVRFATPPEAKAELSWLLVR